MTERRARRFVPLSTVADRGESPHRGRQVLRSNGRCTVSIGLPSQGDSHASIPLAFSLITATMLVTAPANAQSAAHEPFALDRSRGPASDLLDGTLRLPDPGEGAVRSHAAIFWLEWEGAGEGVWAAETQLPVTSGALSIAVQAFDASSFGIECSVDGETAPIGTRRDQLLPADLGGQDVQRLDLDIASAGVASVRLIARSRDVPAPSILVVRDAAGLVASAHVDTHTLLADRSFHLVAQAEREGAPVRGVERAIATIEGPGFDAQLELRDDGLSATAPRVTGASACGCPRDSRAGMRRGSTSRAAAAARASCARLA